MSQGYACMMQGRPISKAAMGSVVRRSLRTVQRYKRAGGIATTRNFVRLRPAGVIERRLTLPRLRTQFGPRVRIINTNDGPWLVVQIADAFAPLSQVGLRGRPKRLRQRFEQTCDYRGTGNGSDRDSEGLENPAYPRAQYIYTASAQTATRGRLWDTKVSKGEGTGHHSPSPLSSSLPLGSPSHHLRPWSLFTPEDREPKCGSPPSTRGSRVHQG